MNNFKILGEATQKVIAKQQIVDPISDVNDFQVNILGIAFPKKPRFMTDQEVNDTCEKLDEELTEFANATTIADQADALVDSIYFALGALHQMGVDTRRVWAAVHEANITKRRGITERGHENDAVKPEGWQPPDHSWLDEAAE